ncbi:hypothetical protein LAZ67_6000626, partial [Cordylochernes scorpioides]
MIAGAGNDEPGGVCCVSVRRTKFCQVNPDQCEKPANITTFCSKYPQYCSGDEDFNDDIVVPKHEAIVKEDQFTQEYLRILLCPQVPKHEDIVKVDQFTQEDLRILLCPQVPKIEAMLREDQFTQEEIKTYGHPNHPLISICMFGGSKDKQNICKNSTFQSFGFMDIYHKTKQCHIVNPQWAQATIEFPKVPLRDVLTVVLDLEPEEYFVPNREVGGQVSFHSPFSISNPFIEGFHVQPGKLYVIQLKEIIKYLLPHPYQTNCTKYVDRWYTRGGKGPLTKAMCVEECILNKTFESCGCAKKSTLYPHDYKFCTEG